MHRFRFISLAIVLGTGGAAPSSVRADPPPLTVAVRVHLVHSTSEWALNTTLTAADVQRVFAKVNTIWSQAGIHLELESICDTPAKEDAMPYRWDEGRWLSAKLPKDHLLPHGIDVFYVKEITPNGIWTGSMVVVKDTAKLQEVPGGVDEPLQRVTSHEIGHALGLPHRQDMTNLMASGTTGFSLNEAEIQTARETAERKYGTKANEAESASVVLPPTPADSPPATH